MNRFRLATRVEEMEENFGLIVFKVETALQRMASVEKTKSIKKESMNKILDTIIASEDGCKLKGHECLVNER